MQFLSSVAVLAYLAKSSLAVPSPLPTAGTPISSADTEITAAPTLMDRSVSLRVPGINGSTAASNPLICVQTVESACTGSSVTASSATSCACSMNDPNGDLTSTVVPPTSGVCEVTSIPAPTTNMNPAKEPIPVGNYTRSDLFNMIEQNVQPACPDAECNAATSCDNTNPAGTIQYVNQFYQPGDKPIGGTLTISVTESNYTSSAQRDALIAAVAGGFNISQAGQQPQTAQWQSGGGANVFGTPSEGKSMSETLYTAANTVEALTFDDNNVLTGQLIVRLDWAPEPDQHPQDAEDLDCGSIIGIFQQMLVGTGYVEPEGAMITNVGGQILGNLKGQCGQPNSGLGR